MSLLSRLTRPLRWSSPRRSARQLLAFARAERSSHFDLLAAANASSDPGRRALYLAHAIDEARHARMFALRAEELDPVAARDPRARFADCEGLFGRLGEEHFVAFVHHGERRGVARLSVFRDEHARRGDEKTRALLDAILRDEARHVAYTAQLLRELLGKDTARALRSVRAWELGRVWLRVSAQSSQLLFALLMRVLYLALFPLALLVRWRARPSGNPWPS